MALDHYVSQVHLRRFYSPDLGNRMYAIRKSDLFQFTPRADDVCRIDEGNTNIYLTEPRVVEEFLKTVEGRYNKAISSLERGDFTRELIYVIAGFISYVMTCSPTAMRLGTSMLRGVLEMTMEHLDEMGEFPPIPPELGGESLMELLEQEVIRLNIDHKYSQAIGIRNVLAATARLGNFYWDILINENTDSPFFTSDYPIAIEKENDPRILRRICPLSPGLAVRIIPDINLPKEKADFSFSSFRYRIKRVTRSEVTNINRLLVRSAENVIFFRDNLPWVDKFIKRNRGYRIENRNTHLPMGNGTIQVSQQQIVALA